MRVCERVCVSVCVSVCECVRPRCQQRWQVHHSTHLPCGLHVAPLAFIQSSSAIQSASPDCVLESRRPRSSLTDTAIWHEGDREGPVGVHGVGGMFNQPRIEEGFLAVGDHLADKAGHLSLEAIVLEQAANRRRHAILAIDEHVHLLAILHGLPSSPEDVLLDASAAAWAVAGDR